MAFHVFATAYVIRKNRRVTLALHYVRKGESLVSVLDALKAYLDQRGIKVKLWLADRAFCSVAALKWLDQQPEAIVPMIARGKQNPLSGSRVLFESNFSYWTDHTMSSVTDGKISLRVAVVRRYGHYSRRHTGILPLHKKTHGCHYSCCYISTTVVLTENLTFPHFFPQIQR